MTARITTKISRACELYGIVPVSTLYRNLNDSPIATRTRCRLDQVTIHRDKYT